VAVIASRTRIRRTNITPYSGPLIATKSSRITFVAEKYWFGKQANGRRSVISRENSQLVRLEQFAAAIKDLEVQLDRIDRKGS
jgi:hypothetical protein